MHQRVHFLIRASIEAQLDSTINFIKQDISINKFYKVMNLNN